MVCPYSFDVPGGVQFHVRDLAEYLIRAGHDVSVIAPSDDEGSLPHYMTSCGRAVPVRYNGSVARLTFGPVTAARVGKWLDRGDFDLLHLHEPVTPSASVLALWGATQPVVATFHTSTPRSRAMHTFGPVLRPSLEKIRARIAVSEDARGTVRRHLRADAYVIPNGVDVDHFAQATVRTEFAGAPTAPTVAFLGRIDEPRKGLSVLLEALPPLLARWPGLQVLVAGPGDVEAAAGGLPPGMEQSVRFLGAVTEQTKAELLRSVDLYIAPHTGGESFGIVLVEAMAAGSPVVASDLTAFVRVLGSPPAGRLFTAGDSTALASAVGDLLEDPAARHTLGARGAARSRRFDWSTVGEQIEAVYEVALDAKEREPESLPQAETLWGKLVRSGRVMEEEL